MVAEGQVTVIGSQDVEYRFLRKRVAGPENSFQEMNQIMSKFVDDAVSSGNVFRDLGLPDADELDIKANLAIKIGQIVARRGLSQVKAAALLGVDQPKVSAIVRGRLEKFSIERLCEFLTRLGCDVNISVQEKNKLARGKMRIQIAS